MNAARRWISLALVLAFIEAWYVFVVSAGKITGWPTYLTYYDLLAEGFRAGHLYLTVLPSHELLAQPDPYALAAADYWMNDLTLYHGRYYFYWGPLPGLLLALVKTLFRISAPVGDQYLVFAFLSLSALCGALILERMTRRLFAPAPFYLLAAGLLAFAFGGPALHLLASTSVYMAAATGAQAFLLLGLVFAADAVIQAKSRAPSVWRLAAVGISWAMALACRVSVVPAVALLVVATVWAAGVPLGRRGLRSLLWIGGPIAAGIVLLLIYNKLRFDAWLDFGVERQLTTWKFKFSLRSFIPNIYNYLFRRFSVSCAFPFVAVPYEVAPERAMPGWLPFQSGYLTPEPVVGLLVAAPIIWLVPAAIRSVVRAARAIVGAGDDPAPEVVAADFAGNRICLWFALAFIIMGTVTLGAPLGLYMATMRYLEDVAPGLLLLANLGLWTLYAQPSASVRMRRLIIAVGVALSGVTILVGVLLGFQGYTGHFERFNPRLAQGLDRALSLCRRPVD